MKPGQTIASLPPEQMGRVVLHPAQLAAVPRIAELIRFLRTCETPAQSFEFQRLLFAEIYRIEERGAECNRVRKRLKACELTSREKPISARVYQIAESACRHRWRR